MELIEAEKAFMEEETKKLHEKFLKEKKELHARLWQRNLLDMECNQIGGLDNMGKIILIGATKGGVGKSVSSYNLVYSLAKLGKKVLAVDFDSQANLTTCFRVEDPAAVSVTIGHLMMAQMDEEESQMHQNILVP